MSDHAIGVFDSGLGGLTVLQALSDLLPTEHLHYLGDTARYPYGSRSAGELIGFSTQITEFLLEAGSEMIVVACNSATAAALTELRESYPVPVIGVVAPGVRAAMAATRTGRVGVIGTEMTAASEIYERTAAELRSGLEMTVLACPGLVELVEAGETRGARARSLVARRLAPLKDADVDTLVLGCTHYPLLARTIGDVMGRDVTLVSSADETAFEVRDILAGTGRRRRRGPGRRVFHTTGDPQRFRRLGERFLGVPLTDVRAHRWDVP